MNEANFRSPFGDVRRAERGKADSSASEAEPSTVAPHLGDSRRSFASSLGVPHLSIIIPAFNEAKRIADSLRTLSRFLQGSSLAWEIRVVDDGSEDDTADIVMRIARDDTRVKLQWEPHRGKGGAVRAGMLASRAQLRFLCDADLSMPIHKLSRFLDAVPHDCDIAIGTREGEAARRVGEPLYRHAMGRVFNALVQKTVLPGIHDTQCGFKMFSARAACAVFSAVTISGWAFDIEVLAIARTQGWRIREVPIEWHYGTESRVAPVRDSYLMLRDLWTIRANMRTGAYGAPAAFSLDDAGGKDVPRQPSLRFRP